MTFGAPDGPKPHSRPGPNATRNTTSGRPAAPRAAGFRTSGRTEEKNRKLTRGDIAAADGGALQPATIENELTAADQPRTASETPAPLFSSPDASAYRTRWSAVQTGFVDEPRKAVEEADVL